MILTINGKEEMIAKALTLGTLIEAKALCPEKIVLEHNGRIVPKENWSQITLRDQDAVEIVSFVGGG